MRRYPQLCKSLLVIGIIGISLPVAAVDQVNIVAEKISHPQGVVKDLNVSLNLVEKQKSHLKAKAKLAKQSAWSAIKMTCQLPADWSAEAWHCGSGQLAADSFSFPFSLNFRLLQAGHQFDGIGGRLRINAADFSDEAGLHAAEGLTGRLSFEVKKKALGWQLKHDLTWDGGELYWDPFYLTGEGHQVKGTATFTANAIKFQRTTLALKSVGSLKLNGTYDLNRQQIQTLNADLPGLDLGQAFPLLFKPLLQNSILQHADLEGKIAFKANIRQARLKALDIQLNNVSIEDQHQHFGFSGLNAHIPWDYDQAKPVLIRYQAGHLRQLSLGPADIRAEVNRFAWTAPQIILPILDGELKLKDFSAARLNGKWYWHLGADIRNIGMPVLSKAFSWPEMQGDVAVHIPQVTYSQERLATNGEIVFDVFDGKTRVTKLEWLHPLGDTSVLFADVAMRSLDLGKLTDTFSFGSIEGRLDGDIDGMVLQNWQPVAFDARFLSSSGKYRKKISQRAVENISALGGAGAVAAIQRSVLRFFKAFNYDKIGLSCRLNNRVCSMDGLPADVGKSTDNGYLIVKGKGIPSITVKGFQQQVSWHELLSRVKRISNENTDAIIE